ncbi:magnesium-translocating P-type ATPase [Methanocella arvoryzae]|uniref:Magnesium-transporting ATPase, P-type 1 n=1 Tax=Methanocella arvoryzae (strain DSM 22066 / NBRC 105507 / MRE50) TaxID=351160 RepID=Q0W1K5_METAR|nr:magnesium-translocating P-type ATPase [Methanocella arvoryzae]CAJ37738.1 putative Mg(2+)-translocating P-type ATPase [Methanocella arvoryzae MRE50]
MADSKAPEAGTRPFWSVPLSELYIHLGSRPEGLRRAEAEERLMSIGPNRIKPVKGGNSARLFLSQFTSPIVLILLFAAGLSFYLGDIPDSVIIAAIVLVSGALGFWQEYEASNAVEDLLARVRLKARVFRDGQEVEVPFEEVVPGDVVILNAGDGVPGDSVIIDARDLFVDEAALTGESYPAEKFPGVLPGETPPAARSNVLFMGTHVNSGTARALVVRTGRSTEFGRVSSRLILRQPPTEFEQGVRHFGYLLMELTLLLIFAIFAINVFLHRPVLDSFIFSLALAVGLTPQLLPAIISINLAQGAKKMARHKVIVKQLSAIENFGSMNVLCSDKTGTITEGKVRFHSASGIDGRHSDKAQLYAYLNSYFEKSFTSPIDDALLSACRKDISKFKVLDEVPYDFARKRLSVLVSDGKSNVLITKGALNKVLETCASAELPDGKIVPREAAAGRIDELYRTLSREGLRTLGIAYKDAGNRVSVTKDDEVAMTFLGIVAFNDPIKSHIVDTVRDMKRQGVALKIFTGDNRLVAACISERLGLRPGIITGPEMYHMTDEALWARVNDVDVFAEVEPNQKERIIHVLKMAGHVVGYMGDGINDAPALHVADVGISVDSAVDVAKEAAAIVLLENDLKVLTDGIEEGRKTFANTLKYVFMATSANFGNMFSMAGASLILPFLPLLPKQILLTNLLTDFPEMTIATDSVDSELVEVPRRWNIEFIKKFMLVFGLVSSIFDFATFGVLLLLLNATPDQLRTGWFVESVISASLIVLVIRTRRPFFQSKPSRYLVAATLLIALLVLILPYSPLAWLMGFVPLPAHFLMALAVIIVLYIGLAEVAKAVFYRYVKF